MIVQRNIFTVKQGKMGDVEELVKEALAALKTQGKARIYTDFVGPQNTMAIEVEHENLAAYEQAYESMFASEEMGQIWEKLSHLMTGEGKTEVWHLHS